MLRSVALDVSPPSSGVVLPALFNYGRGKGLKTPTLSSFFFLLAAGLSLFLLLGLSACSGYFCIAEGAGSWTQNPPMLLSKSVFFLPATRPPLLISPVLLELSSLKGPWSVEHAAHRNMSRRTPLNIRPQSSNPVNKIIHNICRVRLNQFKNL